MLSNALKRNETVRNYFLDSKNCILCLNVRLLIKQSFQKIPPHLLNQASTNAASNLFVLLNGLLFLGNEPGKEYRDKECGDEGSYKHSA